MKVTIKDITFTDMLQADIDNALVSKMDFNYNKATQLLDAVIELDNVTYSVTNQFDNGTEFIAINTSYGKLKLNTNYFHSIIVE